MRRAVGDAQVAVAGIACLGEHGRSVSLASSAISQISGRSCNLGRLPTQVTLLPRNDRGRTRP